MADLAFYATPIRIAPANHVAGVDTTLKIYAISPQVRAFPRVIEGPDTQLNLTSDSISLSVGKLPEGLEFIDNGDGSAFIYGTPAQGTQGVYRIPLTASNGVLPDAKHTLRIVIS